MNQVPPVLLVILDGWGITTSTKGNPLTKARLPVFDRLLETYPHTELGASGHDVGLPANQAGNSEAGHMNIGAGRIVEQDAVRVSRSINQGTFFKNQAFLDAVEHVKQYQSDVHLMGLLTSDQSAHAEPDHLLALLTFFNLSLRNLDRETTVYLHLFTDGRDSYQHLAIKLIKKFLPAFTKGNKIATIIGRFYAMDRIKEWSRVEETYNALVMGEGYRADNAEEAILQAYNRHETDEYIKPTIIPTPEGDGRIQDNDAVVFFNLRSDRVRELTRAFVKPNFEGFTRKRVLQNLHFVTMTNYGKDISNVHVAYPDLALTGTLPFAFNAAGWRQLYIAESEKYAHVTYFFNGGHGKPVGTEEWRIIKSSGAYNYKTHPEMSADKLTDAVITSLESKRHDFIAMNLANADMVGHTGDIDACVKAVECIDRNLGRLEQAILASGGTMLVTADHGNVEEMLDISTGQVDTAHSLNPVPFILINKQAPRDLAMQRGVLGYIAPTILAMVGLPQPKEMSNHTLCNFRIVP